MHVQPAHPRLSPRAPAQVGRRAPVYRVSTFVLFDPLIAEGRIGEIVLNSPVSFDEPRVFAE